MSIDRLCAACGLRPHNDYVARGTLRGRVCGTCYQVYRRNRTYTRQFDTGRPVRTRWIPCAAMGCTVRSNNDDKTFGRLCPTHRKIRCLANVDQLRALKEKCPDIDVADLYFAGQFAAQVSKLLGMEAAFGAVGRRVTVSWSIRTGSRLDVSFTPDLIGWWGHNGPTDEIVVAGQEKRHPQTAARMAGRIVDEVKDSDIFYPTVHS